MKKNLGFLLASLLGGVLSIFIFSQFNEKNTSEVNNMQSESVPVHLASNQAPVHLASNYAPVIQELPDLTSSAEKAVHAVVHIRTEYERKNQYYDDYFGLREFFEHFNQGVPGNSPLMGAGSGVIISENGYIVTNNHVVEDASSITVTLNDKRTYKAKVIGLDPTTDLALIKIEESGLPYLVYGDSDHLKIGEWVLAVGNPFNLTSTVTAGIVSAKARNINILGNGRMGSSIESFIQTDAAVNRGNSGGALVNTRGELVGINAAIASGTGYYAGYSFAIPVNIAKKVVTDLVQYGEIQRAFIGVQISDLDAESAEKIGLEAIQGVYIARVEEQGAAFEAGIEDGDVIVAIDNQAVNSSSELLGFIGQHRPGDVVSLRINRDGSLQTYQVTLKNRKGNTEMITKSEDIFNKRLGIFIEEPSIEQMAKYNVKTGVLVTEVQRGSIAESKGIREGLMITKIDKRSVRTLEDVNSVVDHAEGGILIEGKYSQGSRVYYGFGL